jgi:CheY-like chemotaxis protein
MRSGEPRRDCNSARDANRRRRRHIYRVADRTDEVASFAILFLRIGKNGTVRQAQKGAAYPAGSQLSIDAAPFPPLSCGNPESSTMKPNLASNSELREVLLIDDDLVSREVTATLLTLSGHSVQTVENGDACMKLLADGAYCPDVILMDAQMPGISGAELVAELRAHTRARIYAISASELPSDVAAVVDGSLLKPFAPEALRELFEDSKQPPAAAPPGPEEPVVSPETLAQFRRMMPETAVRQIYSAMITDLERRIEELGAAIGRNDEAEIRRIGHAIKGGCGMAGAVRAARLGALLESGSGGGESYRLDNKGEVLRDLRAATRALERMLEAKLSA